MNHFKRLMVKRRVESIRRLSDEIGTIEGEIAQLPLRRWLKRRQLRDRQKLLRSYIKMMSIEIARASS